MTLDNFDKNSKEISVKSKKKISQGQRSLKNSRSSSSARSVNRHKSLKDVETRGHSSNDPMHRFVEYAVDLKTRRNMLKILHPNQKPIEKNCNRQTFGKARRCDPFPVKEEHSTVCSHIERNDGLKKISGAISKQTRDASASVNRNWRSISPGPADYNKTAILTN